MPHRRDLNRVHAQGGVVSLPLARVAVADAYDLVEAEVVLGVLGDEHAMTTAVDRHASDLPGLARRGKKMTNFTYTDLPKEREWRAAGGFTRGREHERHA